MSKKTLAIILAVCAIALIITGAIGISQNKRHKEQTKDYEKAGYSYYLSTVAPATEE